MCQEALHTGLPENARLCPFKEFCGKDIGQLGDPDGAWYSAGPQEIPMKLSFNCL